MLTCLGSELDALSYAHDAMQAELWDHAYRRVGLAGLQAAGGVVTARCWEGSKRTLVASEVIAVGLECELVGARLCLLLMYWLQPT